METIIQGIGGNPIIHLLTLAIIADTFFGLLRACKQHSFNSSLGINGGIRKIGMMIGILFLYLADHIIHMNMAFMIPSDWLTFFGLEQLGTTEFFGILFIICESISILKNMILLGVPVPTWVKEQLENFLKNMTSEIPKELQAESTMREELQYDSGTKK